MTQRVETINVSLLVSEEGQPYGDVVIFRSNGYYRRYSFTPCLKYTRTISAASMVRCQRMQQKLMVVKP